ncbi:interleukin-17C [Paroedura picta]|uniref:interleukin-17C n=1 Tax=Paroedura picta TaxID=143630 RepID=UPI0040560106
MVRRPPLPPAGARWKRRWIPPAGMPKRSLLLLAFLLLACWAEAKRPHHHAHRQRCFVPSDLPEEHVPTEFLSRSKRWDRHSAIQLVPYLEKEPAKRRRQRRHHDPYNCSALQLQNLQQGSIHERSIAPWSHQINEEEDRYPRKLAFAYCLCKGCIDVKTGNETSSLNSVLVFQEMMVLRRKPCAEDAQPRSFTLEVDYISVPVSCACVLPQSSS